MTVEIIDMRIVGLSVNASAKYTVKPQETDISGMTIAELEEYAQAHGIELSSAKRKADIIAAISKAEAM